MDDYPAVAAPCDALLVLGGEDRQHWPRCRMAEQLYRVQQDLGHKAPKLVVSGGVVVSCAAGRVGTEAELMAIFLQTQGVAPQDILLEPLARNTLGNVVLGGHMALQHGCRRIGLVTDDYHQWRSLRLYQRVFGQPPMAVWGTGCQGTWRQRLRELTAYVRTELALCAAQVPRCNLNGHYIFLQKGVRV